jgi:lambda family phage portal protein
MKKETESRIVRHNGARAIARKSAPKHRPKPKAPKNGASPNGIKAFDGATIGRLTSTWLLSGLSADSEIRTHLFTLRTRCRDLERNNDYARGFGEDMEAQTLGGEGVIVQMKIKEEADRIIHTPDEKAFIEYYQDEKTARNEKIRSILKRRGVSEDRLRAMWPEVKLLHRNGNRAAKVLKGQPDVYANEQIEKAIKRRDLKENYTVSRDLTRKEAERLWLRSTWRDGACLVRMVKGFDNEFGFALQFIDIDWLDTNYNVVLQNGNEVRMGKEYNQWKQCVAYHLLVKNPGDWMWSAGLTGYGATGNSGRFARHRVDASEIIHGYVRERIDQSREIPWMVSVITRLQMLGKYEEAELVASLLSARKTGTWYSDLFSDQVTLTKDFTQASDGEFEEATEPGQDTIAPYGWKYQVNDPKHPNTTIEQFKKVMLQGAAAGLPGSSYHRLSQDPSGLSFSNLRGIELQSRDGWTMIQGWIIDNFHTPTFKPWLESALMSGSIPLPVSKIDKYNHPYFIARRWKGIDPIKEAEANKANILLAVLTRTKIAAEAGYDLEEVIEQLILEEDMLEVGGLDALMLKNMNPSKSDGNSTSDASNPGDVPTKPPKEPPAEE